MNILFLIIPIILVLISGISSASETGLVSIENIRIRQAKKKRLAWAHLVSRFLRKPEQFFSTILVFENLILVIASTLFAKFFIDWLGAEGAIYATIILAVIYLVIGQFIPKSIALSRPEATMRVLSGTIYTIEIVAYPLVTMYAFVARMLAKLVTRGIQTDSIKRLDIIHAMSEYEVKASKLAARLFDFSKRQVAEVMIPLDLVYMCKKEKEIAALKTRNGRIFTRIPVYEETRENIIGVFNIKDYFYKGKITLRKPLYVKSHERCMTIFMSMKQQGKHMAIIEKEKNKAIGIVTLEDLIEELIGEIRDEQ